MWTRHAIGDARAQALDLDEVTTRKWHVLAEEEQETLRRSHRVLGRRRRVEEAASARMMLALEAAIVQRGPTPSPPPVLDAPEPKAVRQPPSLPAPARRSPPPPPPRAMPVQVIPSPPPAFVRQAVPAVRSHDVANPNASSVMRGAPPVTARRWRTTRAPLMALVVALAIGFGLWRDHDARAEVGSSWDVMVKTALGHLRGR